MGEDDGGDVVHKYGTVEVVQELVSVGRDIGEEQWPRKRD